MKICLGTAQQGMAYGIRGDLAPEISNAVELYQHALRLGVDTFDTAAGYGRAEDALGAFFRAEPAARETARVVSKLRPDALCGLTPPDYFTKMLSELETSLEKLGLPRIDGYMLHNAALAFDNDALEAMSRLKDTGLAAHTGVSIYTPEQALAAAGSPYVDYIQVPYNALDHRLDRTDFFERAKGNGKIIFARSVFLQGLLLMSPDEILKKLPRASKYVEDFRSAAGDLEPYEACIAWSRARQGIDYLVIGVADERELEKNIAMLKKEHDYSDYIKCMEKTSDVPEDVVRPDLW